ncbi:isoprenylcysteine carboxylmethyltransferase family protein [Bradyrhizobium sp.]|uniref:methyltransferase family protein n=1 Tax=Bradyrhizobium sp. TaxID=376 RepID=UPI002397978E|nr:isoprenylcysteine carboxylmethyltransferase family protein [Bradyrhizobium sp.]MDE1932837.1 isoprenylcysteine carboxylmethyltransferase family protein [Bradyrhizobium sp.]
MSSERARELIGIILVILQFALLAVLGWQVVTNATGISISSLVLLLGGVLLGLWALSANRPGNFNIRPQPKPGGKLIEKGPYHMIRHPMYLSVILVGLAAALVSMQTVAWICWAVLVAVLAAKAILEEKALLQQMPEYSQYRARTSRFLPGVF